MRHKSFDRCRTGVVLVFLFSFFLGACAPYSRMKKEWDRANPADWALRIGGSGESIPSKERHMDVLPRRATAEEGEKTWEDTLSYDFQSEKAKGMRALATQEKSVTAIRGTLSLDLLLCLAYERNLELQSLRKKYQAARDRYAQVDSLYDTMESYASFARSLELSTGMPMKPEISAISPFPRSFALMGEIVSTEVRMAHLQYATGVRDMVARLGKEYAELLFVQEAKKIYRESLGIVRALEETARERFKAGAVPYADVLKAQIAKAQIELDMETYVRKKETVWVRLLAEMDLPADTEMGEALSMPIGELALPLETLYSMAKEKREEIKSVELRLQRQERMIALAKSDLYPPFTLGLGYFEDKNAERVGSFSTTPTFAERPALEPRPWTGTGHSYVREMETERKAIEKELEQTRASTVSRVRDLYFDWDTACRAVATHRDKLIPLAGGALEVAQASYRAPGAQVDFLDVLDAQRTLLDLRLSLRRNERDTSWALIELKKTTGGCVDIQRKREK